jgi:hypothetical protein
MAQLFFSKALNSCTATCLTLAMLPVAGCLLSASNSRFEETTLIKSATKAQKPAYLASASLAGLWHSKAGIADIGCITGW